MVQYLEETGAKKSRKKAWKEFQEALGLKREEEEVERFLDDLDEIKVRGCSGKLSKEKIDIDCNAELGGKKLVLGIRGKGKPITRIDMTIDFRKPIFEKT